MKKPYGKWLHRNYLYLKIHLDKEKNNLKTLS